MTLSRACAILDVPETATLEVARRAFKRLAHSAHPDRGGSHQRFVELSEAWETFQSLRHKPRKAPKAAPEPQASVNFGLGSMMQVVAVRVAQLRHEAVGTATLRKTDEDELALELALSVPLSVSLAVGTRVLVEMSFEGHPIVMSGATAQVAYDDLAGKALSWVRLVELARI